MGRVDLPHSAPIPGMGQAHLFYARSPRPFPGMSKRLHRRMSCARKTISKNVTRHPRHRKAERLHLMEQSFRYVGDGMEVIAHEENSIHNNAVSPFICFKRRLRAP